MYFIICFPLAMLVSWLERRAKEPAGKSGRANGSRGEKGGRSDAQPATKGEVA